MSIRRKLLAAYAMMGHADAGCPMGQIHRELDGIKPSSATSRSYKEISQLVSAPVDYGIKKRFAQNERTA
jgi:hypothetical protein